MVLFVASCPEEYAYDRIRYVHAAIDVVLPQVFQQNLPQQDVFVNHIDESHPPSTKNSGKTSASVITHTLGFPGCCVVSDATPEVGCPSSGRKSYEYVEPLKVYLQPG